MKYLLDTNACIEHLRRGSVSAVSTRLKSTPVGDVCLCSVVRAELVYGAHRSANPSQENLRVAQFAQAFVSLPFDDAAANHYGEIRAYLDSCGAPIGPNDLLIAAIARANRLIVVTTNTGEFSRVPGLTCENWSAP